MQAEHLDSVLALVEAYLMSTNSAVASAAWMAGDLLGDHWDLRQSLPILTRLATQARYVAGRDAAIHGLSRALARARKASQWAIVQVLKDVSRHDRSRRVRSHARGIVGHLRGL